MAAPKHSRVPNYPMTPVFKLAAQHSQHLVMSCYGRTTS